MRARALGLAPNSAMWPESRLRGCHSKKPAPPRALERIAFIAREADGALIGYWLGDDASDLEDAPIIFLSNEGSFYFGGDNLVEYMIYSCDADMFVDDEETVSVEQHIRQWLSNAGCSAPAPREALQAKIDGQSARFDEVFGRFQAAGA